MSPNQMIQPLFLSHVLLICTLYVGFFANPNCGFTNETDRESLIAFKDLVKEDPLRFLRSWNQSTHFCNWLGVTCGLRHQRVTILNMSALNLGGLLSPQLGNLSFLHEINLQGNNFHGRIPREFGKLFRLQFLRLANNSFQGRIPLNLTNCSNLQVLDLRGNNLEGKIPPELGTLSKLYGLSLSRNHLFGTIPASLGNLSSLRILGLSRNSLFGSIPTEFGQLSELYSFELSSNELSGLVPAQLYNISSLQIFSVTNNSLSGNFPPNLGLTLPQLQSFLADLNHFSGSIPESLANASSLVKISIGDNNLTGPIPRNLGSLQELQLLHIANNPLDKTNDISFLTSLTNCSNLGTLSLSGIQIGGELPDSIANLSRKLTWVWMDQNYISGSIPRGIGELVSLAYLTIDTNMLTGSIPDTIGKLTNLKELYLFTNKISGEIPFSIGNITGLSALVLEDNLLEGGIPVSLGNCSGLQGLHLAQNRLTGPIPEEVISLSSLSLGFIVFRNYLTGPLPTQVGKLENLVNLDVSDNKLSGEIPSTLGNCLMLNSLEMEGNSFNGTIPPELKNLRSIQFIDLSRNNLSGEIPEFLGELKLLRHLNLSFNMLDGEVPNEGVFTNISLFSVSGNNDLCGGLKQLELPSCPSPTKPKKNSSHKVIVVTTTIGVFIIFLSLCVSAVLYRARKSKQQPCLALGEENNYPKLRYRDLFESTNGFSLDNLVGKGKYGSVYKGILNSGEQIVAVKVLNLQESRAEKSFLSECEALRKLRHRNLVKIITSCSSLDSRGNDFKALVFEFMPNGSLEGWLYQQDDTKKLNLIQRLNIAIDVASALDYLHHHYDIPIVHCDLKPSNVLLDNNLCARIGDFGLARFLLAATGESKYAQSSSMGIRGTVGYVAPEYGMGAETSTQGDVYSYGILLLEIFTGKRPTNSIFTDSFNLHSYAKIALPHRVIEILDPQIRMEEEEEEGPLGTSQNSKGNAIEECLASILQVGVSCSAEAPRDRMDMKNVVTELHRIKNFIAQVQGNRRKKNEIDMKNCH